MKDFLKVMLAVILVGLFAVNAGKFMRVEAQTAAPFSFSVSAPHANCPAVAVGVSQYCFATDGIWQSLNGAAWAQVGVPVTAGVTSLNGKAGNLTISANSSTPTVTVSVN